MNFPLPYVPHREQKPRKKGLTMMMDKGISLQETENFCDAASEFTDIVKFGFGTAVIAKKLKEKIHVYRQAGIEVYFGGTLFELFAVRGKIDEFFRLIDTYQLTMVEISDGSMNMPHDLKLEYIRQLSKRVTVVSEVGYKISGVTIPTAEWVSMMKTELEAGAWKVIAEARESGNVGIYNPDGSANAGLICDIIHSIDTEMVIWEAPNKNQQAYFIKLLGPDVNLGNIATHEVVALETLRLGLRGDTFFDFLPESLLTMKIPQ